MTEVTADTIAVRVLFEADQAQRNAHAYGIGVQRAMATVEVSTSKAANAAAAASAKQSEAYRSLGRSISSAVADAIEGKNAFAILGQHGTDVASAFTHFGGTVGRVATFLSGPWGVAINTAVAAGGLLASKLLDNEGAARRAEEGARAFAERQSDMTRFIDPTTGKIIEQNKALIDNAILLKQRKIDTQQAIVDDNRLAATRAIRLAAIVEPTPEERYAAERGGGIVSAGIDRTLLGTLKGGRTDLEGLYRRVDALAAGRPELSKLRETVGEAVAKATDAQRQMAPLVVDRDALRGDKAAIKAWMERQQRGQPAGPAVSGGTGPSIVIAAPSGSANISPSTPAGASVDAAAVTRAANDALAALSAKGDAILDAEAKADAERFGEQAKVRREVADDKFNERIAEVTKAIEAARGASETLARDLSSGLTQAILKGESLGKVLENAFLKAGAAAIQSRIFDLLTTGEVGGLFKSIGSFVAGPAAAKAPGRASGGHVSAGQLYRVNELGTEGFRPAGSGTIVPLGRMAAQPRGGGVTVVQPLNVSFAGAITTPELMAQFKAYADGVGQAAAIGGAAMAQARMARRAARALPR